MKKLIIILISLSLFACDKRNQKSYLIENWSNMELSLNTPDNSYLIPGKSRLKIISSDYKNFNYLYDGYFARIDTKNEHPTRTIMVIAYTHRFSVHIGGNADSAYINNKKVELPYYNGTNNDISKYNYTIIPIGFDYIESSIRVNDREIDKIDHYDGKKGVLSGNVNY